MNPLISRTYVSPGDILSTNAESIRPELFAACEDLSPGSVIQLDLRAARMIDSVGLNLIVSLIRQVKGKDASIQILVSNKAVHRMMTFTRIDQHARVQVA